MSMDADRRARKTARGTGEAEHGPSSEASTAAVICPVERNLFGEVGCSFTGQVRRKPFLKTRMPGVRQLRLDEVFPNFLADCFGVPAEDAHRPRWKRRAQKQADHAEPRARPRER